MLTTFDVSFDYTFARAALSAVPVFPVVGGDGGARVPASVLPFSDDPARLPSCFQPAGQGWERWVGVPMSTPDYLLPFIAVVSRPANIPASVYCQGPITIVNADTGAVVITLVNNPIHYLANESSLYLLHSGSSYRDTNALGNPDLLADGTYRIQIGPTGPGSLISDPFRIKCQCRLLKVRLLNDTKIGDLLYGQYGFQQEFYVEGDLTGPTYEESETRSGEEKTAGSVRKIWTLSLSAASEPVADALAHAGLHRLVEVSIVNLDGSFYRPIQALSYQAKAKVSARSAGGFDVELTLPVALTSWGGAASDGSNCDSASSGVNPLLDIACL